LNLFRVAPSFCFLYFLSNDIFGVVYMIVNVLRW